MKKLPAVMTKEPRLPIAAPAPVKPAAGVAGFFALTIFVGAFLLFAVQPLIAKFILPWFGGSSAVWTTCMLFFQIFLVAGYAYAHLTTRYLTGRSQATLHLVLLLAAFAALPIVPGSHWKPDAAAAPAWRILELLTVCLGLPYFVLSATGPLLQAWFVRLQPGVSPYRLYALSNVGSLLALVSYPFIVEPALTRQTQANAWALGFGIFVVLCASCAWLLWKGGRQTKDVEPSSDDPRRDGPIRSATDKALWFLLPFCGSVVLLATTNKLCLDIASFPFLWVLPLSLYLLTFILCFDRPAWYARKVFTLLLVPAFVLICVALFRGSELPLSWQAAIYAANLLISCMVCHGEVYRLKPAARGLTSFYLLIAMGGAAGGIFVALVAPLLFRSYAEMNWSIWLSGALIAFIHIREWTALKPRQRTLPGWPIAVSGLSALGIVLWSQSTAATRDTVARTRNFYAVLRVMELNKGDPAWRAYRLVNGNIDHGLQFLDPVKAALPASYYNAPSGIGLTMGYFGARTNLNVGIVGLGTGTMAAYGRAGDDFRFYELNPEVVRIARTWFSYLQRSKANVTIIPGDARLSLEREPVQNFDVLVLDAFSSDAVPVHLLTHEAFDTYARHLKPDGVIAIHVSNRNLDLIPVVMSDMEHLDMDMVFIPWSKTPMPFGLHSSSWLLMSHSQKFLKSDMILSRARPPQSPFSTNSIAWTDDYASLLPLIKR